MTVHDTICSRILLGKAGWPPDTGVNVRWIDGAFEIDASMHTQDITLAIVRLQSLKKFEVLSRHSIEEDIVGQSNPQREEPGPVFIECLRDLAGSLLRIILDGLQSVHANQPGMPR